MTSRSLFFLLLIFSFGSSSFFCAADVSLKKLFMMMEKPRQQQQQAAGQEQQQGYQECINPQIVEVIKEELTTAKASRDQVKEELEAFLKENKQHRSEAEKSSQERDAAIKELTNVRKELEDLRRDTKKTIEQMEQTSDAAQRVAQVQEDFAKRLAQVQTKAQRDLETAQATIVQQTEELRAMEAELSKERANKVDKNVLTSEQAKVKALEEEKATLQGELKAIQALYKKLEEKNDTLLAQNEEAVEELVNTRLKTELENKEEEMNLKWKKVMKDYERRLGNAYGERNELQASHEKEMEQVRASHEEAVEELVTTRLKTELENKEEEMNLKWKKVMKDYERRLGNAYGERNELRASHEKEMEQIRASQEEAVEELVTTRLKTALENKEEEMNLKWKKVMKDYERRLGNAYGERNELRASHEKEMEQVRASHEEAVEELVTTRLKTELENKEEEMNLKWKKVMKDYERRLGNAYGERNELRASHEKEMEQVRASHKEEIKALNHVLNVTTDSKKKLETQIETMTKTVEELEAKVKATKKDAAYWETAFNERSYLNWTYIAEGTKNMIHSAADGTGTMIHTTRQVSSRKLNEWQKTSSIDFSTAKQQVSHVTAKYVENTNKLYERHLKEHVDKGIEKARPVYNAHVAPVVEKGVKAATEARHVAKKKSDSAFLELSAQFQNACPKVMSGLKEAKEKKGMPVPSGVTDGLQRSCQDPEGSVSMFLRAMAVLFVIIFHRTLWRILVWVIRVIFSPILFLFGRSRKEEPIIKQEKDQVDEQKQAASKGVKEEQNGEQEKDQVDEQKASNKAVNETNGTAKNGGRTKARKNGARTRSSRRS